MRGVLSEGMLFDLGYADGIAPALAVVSLGWRNHFHFPAAEVVARYEARGATVLRTDRDGAVTVVITPDGHLDVSCERGCPVSFRGGPS